jgi:tuftelin-interacting protein 11
MLSDGSDSDASMASDDDGYNSQEDGDSRAERALFERKHKRPRTGGKEAAWEGIFGAEPEQQARGRGGLGTRGGKPASGSRSDWTK